MPTKKGPEMNRTTQANKLISPLIISQCKSSDTEGAPTAAKCPITSSSLHKVKILTLGELDAVTLGEERGRTRMCDDYQPERRAIDLGVVSRDDWTVLTDLVTTKGGLKNSQSLK